MQWADTSLLDFVEYLLEWSRNSPIFVITLARPELADRRPNWGRGAAELQLALPRAAPAGRDGGAARRSRSRAARRRFASTILARAEGIPLYAVETVRMLLDRGALVQDGPCLPRRRRGRVARGAGNASRPDRGAARRPRGRRAAVAPGRRGARQDVHACRRLAALSGLPARELEPLLASLVRKEVLGVQADPRSPEHGQYGFLQDLLRHVAYETLSKRERRARHLAAAEQLAATFGEDEVAEVVASHLLEAYRRGTRRRRRRADQAGRVRGPCPRGRPGRIAGRGSRGAALLRAGGGARRRPVRADAADRPSRPDGVSRGSNGRGANLARPRPRGLRGRPAAAARGADLARSWPTSTSSKDTHTRPSRGWSRRSPRSEPTTRRVTPPRSRSDWGATWS